MPVQYDTIIHGGTIHTSTRSFVGDIGIRGEKIVTVTDSDALKATGHVIDATGLDVIPGCIDVHVHLDLDVGGGVITCDDFDSGSRAAAAGCLTTVLDFATPEPGQSLLDSHHAWMKKADGVSLVDYAWHLSITDDSHLPEIPAMIDRGLPTFKAYMIYEDRGLRSDDERLSDILRFMKKHDGMLLVHAESHELLDRLIAEYHTPEMMKRYGVRLHAMTRPDDVEAIAIKQLIHHCDTTGGALYVVHCSTGRGAELIEEARRRGVNVRGETCPHYLTLDDSVFEDEEAGHLFASCPQLKKKTDVERLWQAICDESINVVSTDTCSFTRQQKDVWDGDWTRIPMGLPGLDTLVPLVYTLGVRGGRFSMNRLVELCSTNPADVMGMGDRKGRIEVGYDADIALIDPARTVEVDWRHLQSRCDWSPYQGMSLGGFAHTTLVRGTVVVDEYEVVGENGVGRFVERSLKH